MKIHIDVVLIPVIRYFPSLRVQGSGIIILGTGSSLHRESRENVKKILLSGKETRTFIIGETSKFMTVGAAKNDAVFNSYV